MSATGSDKDAELTDPQETSQDATAESAPTGEESTTSTASPHKRTWQ